MNLLIGDSHILALQKYGSERNKLYEFSASSIAGLVNHNSFSGTRERILSILNMYKFDKLFIMFGKVDMEWVYPYKNKKGPIDMDAFIKDTVNKYFTFIDEIAHHFNDIYIMGLHPPSLGSTEMIACINSYKSISYFSQKNHIVNNLDRISELGDLKTRTEQILTFNNLLKKRRDKYQYIDINDILINQQTQLCDDFFINPGDHHLDRDKTGAVWFDQHLKALIF